MYTIQQMFGLRPPGPLTPRATPRPELVERMGKARADRVANQAVGVEIEVERAGPVRLPLWIHEVDNSLRNGGLEYKTIYGLRLANLDAALVELESGIEDYRSRYGKAYFDFTERTSVHVHLDGRTFTEDEVVSALIVYTIFEDALFDFAGPERKHNVFCIPLRYSRLDRAGWAVDSLITESNKYAAMNIRTLCQFGTFEFRHMRGNCDSKKIQQWATLLALLLDYSRRTPRKIVQKEVIGLKFSSNYHAFASEVFGGYADLLTYEPRRLDKAVSDAKLFFSIQNSAQRREAQVAAVDGLADIAALGARVAAVRQAIRRPQPIPVAEDALNIQVFAHDPEPVDGEEEEPMEDFPDEIEEILREEW